MAYNALMQFSSVLDELKKNADESESEILIRNAIQSMMENITRFSK